MAPRPLPAYDEESTSEYSTTSSDISEDHYHAEDRTTRIKGLIKNYFIAFLGSLAILWIVFYILYELMIVRTLDKEVVAALNDTDSDSGCMYVMFCK